MAPIFLFYVCGCFYLHGLYFPLQCPAFDVTSGTLRHYHFVCFNLKKTLSYPKHGRSILANGHGCKRACSCGLSEVTQKVAWSDYKCFASPGLLGSSFSTGRGGGEEGSIVGVPPPQTHIKVWPQRGLAPLPLCLM